MLDSKQDIRLHEGGNAIIIGVVVLAVLVVGGMALIPAKDAPTDEGGAAMMEENTPHNEDGAMMEVGGDEAMKEDTSAMMEQKDGAAMESDKGAMMEEGGAMMEETKVAGSYEEYAPEKLARAEEGDVVLFFHATWCPSCRSADKNISGASVPEGLTVLKLNYDKETDLRKKYGVTTQHSFVQVDAQGNMVKKWVGSSSAADIAAQVL